MDARRSSLGPRPETDDPDGKRPWDYRDRLAEEERLRFRSAFGSAVADRAEVSPILGTAPHWSHRVRGELHPKLAIDETARLYDEDPFTERFTGRIPHVVLPTQSRYEVDMNRPPDVAIYASPELAWGRTVWDPPLDQHEREATLEKWYEFHSMLDAAILDAIDRFGFAVLFDVHSYNYQREDEADWRDDGDPVINLGTAHLRLDDRGEAILDWMRDRLQGFTVQGEPATFGENEVFYGGYINRRVSRCFGPRCVTLSVEFKKVFMDETTGEPHPKILGDLVDQFDRLVTDLGERLDTPVRDPPEVVVDRGDPP